ncbi:enolase [Patescibacteria group bacterium]|nr:enolase [Patescibacteria group bacterium]
MKIRNIIPREILDSRGNPTIEVELEIPMVKPSRISRFHRGSSTKSGLNRVGTNNGNFLASVPSGKSKGKYEALELRDEDGKGVKKAISNIKKIVAPALKDKEFSNQREVDDFLIKLDGTENKSRLGVNAILPVSVAACRALATDQNLPLYKYIAQLAGLRNPLNLPKPCFNIIEGGAHVPMVEPLRISRLNRGSSTKSGLDKVGTDGSLDIQEFMVIPQKQNFRDNFRVGSEIFQSLKEILIKNFGKNNLKIGDEKGFAPQVSKTEQALYLIKSAIEKHPDTKIGLDAAVSQFYQDGRYKIENQELNRSELLGFYKDLIDKFPIIFIEDAFAEDDWQGFEEITKELSDKIIIFGDDLLTTNIKRIKEAQAKLACNGLILKPNQIGTVTETLEAVKLARAADWKILVAHRSGETTDDFIADLAVGIGAEFIKAGAPITPERMVKYNRLLEIEEDIARH